MLKKLQINNKAGKQAALGGIISIIGVVLGFLNAGLLQPLLLEPSQIGQLKLFTSLSSVLGIIGLLGFEAAGLYFFRRRGRDLLAISSIINNRCISNFPASPRRFIYPIRCGYFRGLLFRYRSTTANNSLLNFILY